MQYYIIIFRSLTYAQRAAVILEKSGVTASVGRAPQELIKTGCGYGVKVSEKKFQQAMRALDRNSQAYLDVFLVTSDGRYLEVRA